MGREITEQDAFKALGLGGRVQEPAAPASGANTEPAVPNTGAQVQEPAAPAGQDPVAPASQGAPPEGNGGGNPTPLTEEQRKENAARRRREEQQNAINAAVQAEQEKNATQLKDLFEKLGLKDPVSGEPITTMEQFGAYQQSQAIKKLENDLASGKLTQEGLNAVISQHPAVKAAEQAAEAKALADKEAQEQAAQKEMQTKVAEQIAEIQKMDPSITKVEDLLNMPNSKEFYAAVQRVGNLADAYKLVNFDQVVGRRAELARQEAQTLARSKEHLVPVASRGEGAVTVPSDVLANYRKLNPKASDAEIQANYAKYLKKKQGG